MLVVFDAYLSTWNTACMLATSFILFFSTNWPSFTEKPKKQLPLIAPSRGRNSLSLSHFYIRNDVVSA